MQMYEALVIVKAAGTEAEMMQSVGQVEEPIKKLGGSVASAKPMGRRRLAFRIGKQTEGFYHLVEFKLPTNQVGELKRLLRLNESIIRFLILNRPPTVPVSVGTAAVAPVVAVSA